MSSLFLLALVALVALNAYVLARAARVLGLARRGRWVLAGTFVALIVAGVLTRFVVMPRFLATAVGATAMDLELAVLISGGLLLLVDALLVLGWALAWPVRRVRARSAARRGDPEAALLATAPPPADDVGATAPTGRREMLVRTATGLALAAGAGSTLYGAVFGRRDYQLETVPVRVPGLPLALDGFTLVQLSDVHIGSYVGDAELRAAEALAREARGDLIVLTGDLLDHDPRYADRLSRWVRRLSSLAPRGVVMIPGNHDWYAGVEAVLEAVRRGGARTLVNEGIVLGDAGARFALLGVEDLWSRREGFGPDLPRALAQVPPDLARVLLCHNPAFFHEAAPHVGVMLSGHTHGGQVNVGPNLARLVLPFGYVAGAYRRGDATLYVNRGFGTAGPPARVGSPPEVSRIVLVAA